MLPGLQKEVKEGKRARHDFVFIDANKENNTNHLKAAIEMCNPRGCIIVDNAVRRGTLAGAELAKTDSRIGDAREVIEAAGADPRLEATVLQTVSEKNYDGFMMYIVKKVSKAVLGDEYYFSTSAAVLVAWKLAW